MDFTKAHGTGNDFVVLVDLAGERPLDAALARALCDRRTGIGADGVLRIGAGGVGTDVTMDHRNADGSLAEMCGNGVRVVAQQVVERAIVPVGDEVRVATGAGPRSVVVRRGADGRVVAATVDMGAPAFDPAAVPFLLDPDDRDGSAASDLHRVAVDGTEVGLAVVSMGNPHAVVPVDDVDRAEVARVGAALESHPRFPARANVGFAQVIDRATVRLRVWERGVGETAACGTGACAAAAALGRIGRVGPRVDVLLPGGTLTVEAAPDGGLRMTGAVVEVARGSIDRAWLAAVRANAATSGAAGPGGTA